MVQRRFEPAAQVRGELYDIPRVAALLNVKETFVRSLVAKRTIPFFKVGKFIRFDPVDLAQWLDHRRADVLR